MENQSPIGCLVLAAGASQRLGSPKQLLTWQGDTLLQHTIKQALAAGFAPVGVVTGAHADQITPTLAGFPVSVVHHPEWAQGMGSSVKAGLEYLLGQYPRLSALLMLVCDQPFLSAAHLRELTAHWQKVGGIVASAYAGTVGVPAIFPADLFPDLLALSGQQGARKLFDRYPDRLHPVPFPEGERDIDTPADRAKWLGAD